MTKQRPEDDERFLFIDERGRPTDDVAKEKFECELFNLEMREKDRVIARLVEQIGRWESKYEHVVALLTKAQDRADRLYRKIDRIDAILG